MLRIGEQAIVSFPNFGHWRVRPDRCCSRGRMPVTRNLPHSWYDTPNIHFCTIRDFVELCDEVRRPDREGAPRSTPAASASASTTPWWFWNLFGQQAVFLLSR